MKKILLTLGAITAVIAPVAAVVACGDSGTTPGDTGTAALDITDAKTMPELEAKLASLKDTYTGQEGTKDAMTINIKDGSNVLNITITKADSEANGSKIQEEMKRVMDFFKEVLTRRKIDTSELDGDVTKLMQFMGNSK